MRIFLLVLSFILFLGGGALYADMLVQEADPVPSGLSEADSKELQALKQDLDNEFEAISSDVQQYNALCSGAIKPAGCEGRYYALTGRMSTYNASLARYRSAIRAATKK